METKEDPTQYFEDLTAENEEGSQPTKKVGLPRKGHYSNYTHFISIPLIGEEIKAKILSFEVPSL